MLNTEQASAANAVLQDKRNVYISGMAGSGKSYLIEHIRQQCNRSYQVCAPTGIAALNIKGTTIHSFFRLSPHAIVLDDYLRSKTKKRSVLKSLDLLIIDEISMVQASLLDLLDAICRHERKQPTEAFGGLQVVLVGDFAQLGPVSKSTGSPFYAFESDAWQALNLVTCHLSISQRHPDPYFASFMEKLRMGCVDDDVIGTLKELSAPMTDRPTCYVNNKTVVLESLNAAKDARNAKEHATNPNKEMIYEASYTGNESRMKSCLAPDHLSLKIGSPVLHLANIPPLLNGSSGEVVGFTDDDKPLVQFYDRDLDKYCVHVISRYMWRCEERMPSGDMVTVASKTQYPLVLAYSWSVHKSQSTTLDPVSVNLADVFAKSQAYVALSRARAKDGLQVSGLKSYTPMYLRQLFTPDERVLRFYNKAQ